MMRTIHWIAASALAAAGIACLAAGRWKLAFVPLACAAMVGAVALASY
ncbi:hypothetical protein [Paraburkholderia youngii]